MQMNQTNYSLDNTIDSLTSNKMNEEVKEIITEGIRLALKNHFKGKFNKIPQHQAYSLLWRLLKKAIERYWEKYGNPKAISNLPKRSKMGLSKEEKNNNKKVRSSSFEIEDKRNPLKKNKRSKDFKKNSSQSFYSNLEQSKQKQKQKKKRNISSHNPILKKKKTEKK